MLKDIFAQTQNQSKTSVCTEFQWMLWLGVAFHSIDECERERNRKVIELRSKPMISFEDAFFNIKYTTHLKLISAKGIKDEIRSQWKQILYTDKCHKEFELLEPFIHFLCISSVLVQYYRWNRLSWCFLWAKLLFFDFFLSTTESQHRFTVSPFQIIIQREMTNFSFFKSLNSSKMHVHSYDWQTLSFLCQLVQYFRMNFYLI